MNFVGQLNAKKLAALVLLYVFIIGFPTSLFRKPWPAWKVFHPEVYHVYSGMLSFVLEGCVMFHSVIINCVV